MLDKVDRKLINDLQKNGRESFVVLSKRLGVTEGTVRKRIKQLVGNNVIRIVAEPNLNALGYNLTSIIGIQVKMVDLRKVADLLARKRQVCRLSFVTGRYDLIAIVVTESPQALSNFIEKEISTVPSVLRTETFVNLDVMKGGWSGIDTTQLIHELLSE